MVDSTSANQVGGQVWTVSSVLRRARETMGLSLADVADILRIRIVQLRAIEDGRFHELPGTVYAIGFVRSYADLVGLDSDRVVQMYRDEIASPSDRQELVFPSPVQESAVPGGALLALAVVLAVAAYAGWYYVASPNRDLADLVPGLPDRFAALIEGDAEEVQESPIGTQADDAAITVIGVNVDTDTGSLPSVDEVNAPAIGANPRTVTAFIPEPESPALEPTPALDPTLLTQAPDAPFTPRLGNASAPTPAESPPSQTVFAPTQPPFGTEPVTGLRRPEPVDTSLFDEPLRRRSHDATTAEAATPFEPAIIPDTVASLSAFDDLPLPPPEETAGVVDPTLDSITGQQPRIVIRAVADSWVQVNDSDGSLVMTRVLRPGDSYEVPEDGLRLVTGNAGGLEILVDGQRVPALGASGVVLRNVPLDPNRLQNGTASPN